MNEANNDRCRCNPCTGSECNCGCQQRATQESVARAGCTCGPECRCGSACGCGVARHA